ncbi:MAG: hypothetical protein IIY54_03940 [Ruminococcus sp.]|nr:hypothetical protein [Ruminococcus sp.]
MATCAKCVHVEVCKDYIKTVLDDFDDSQMCGDDCEFFQDRSRFVELNIAKKIKHTPDIDKMREFHKLGLGKGMGERSIFWTCSNCKLWVSLAHKFCPNCGAKFEAEQALKEREENAN